MSMAVYQVPVPAYSFGQVLERPVVLSRYGQQTEQRSTRSGRTYRLWNLTWQGLTDAERAILDAFYVARGGTSESFLWRNPDPTDPDPWYRQAVALGTSIALQTVFNLVSGTSEFGGDYPVDDAGAILKSDGAVIAKTVQVDARTMTASVAPGAGHTITADYRLYRRVRFDGPLQWGKGDHGLWGTAGSFREVPA